MVTQTYHVETRTFDERQTAVVLATLAAQEIGPWLGGAFEAVARYLSKWGAGPVGPPFARYHRTPDGRFEVEAGFVAITPVAGEGDVEPSDLAAGPAAVTVHVGGYGDVAAAYDALGRFVAEQGGVPDGDPYEVYLSDPRAEPDPASWRTEVVQPYRTG
jgi:effector-binding domain-containing protein